MQLKQVEPGLPVRPAQGPERSRGADRFSQRTSYQPVQRTGSTIWRRDIETWFDWLELDDYVTFGGRP